MVVSAALIAMVAAPAAVVANHSFIDVPSDNTFHTNIANIKGAGITSGCGGGNYCPKDPVTREQMAAFLNRAAPRVSISYFATPLGNTPGGQPAHNSVFASTPVRSIGSEALLIEADFFTFLYAGSGTYPCETLYRFRVDSTLVGTAAMYDRALAAPANSWETKTMSGSYVISVPPGDHTVSLVYQKITNSCSMYPGNGVLTVQPIPFRYDMGTFGSAMEGQAAEPELLQSNGEPVE